jgi:hypothetical protein
VAFASYDDLIAEMTAGKRLSLPFNQTWTVAPVAGVWYDLWPLGGTPGSGVYTGTNYTFTRTTETTAGALYHGGAKSPDTKHLIRFLASQSAAALDRLMVIDRVGYYPIPNPHPTVAQALTNTSGPDRYVSAGEPGLRAFIVNAGAGGATVGNLSALSYTDQDGNAGAAMPTTPTVGPNPASSAAPSTTTAARFQFAVGGLGPFLPLAAGDVGMRSVQSITFSAAINQLAALVLCRPLISIPLSGANAPTERELVMMLAGLQRVYDSACLSLLAYAHTATAMTQGISGELDVAWG